MSLHPHLTYCDSLGDWTARCTCEAGVPCAEYHLEVDLDRREHEDREAGL